MRQHKGDIWALSRTIQDAGKPAPLIFITTNGYVKKDGKGVMGAGIAKEAKNLFEGVDKSLGEALIERGNVVSYLGTWNLDNYEYRLFSFPVKDHWRDAAKNELIIKSMQYAEGLARKLKDVFILIPRPGCGNGRRDWQTEIQPLVAPYVETPPASDKIIFLSK